MKVTPIEIRQKDFQKVFRGYEKEEVDAFLLSLSQEWEKMQDEIRELRKKSEATEKEVNRLREAESSLFRALKTAEEGGLHVVEQANRTAEIYVREAQLRAEGLMNEARTKARAMIEEAEEKAREVTDKVSDEVKALHKDYKHIQTQREQLVQELKKLMQETLDRLSKAGTTRQLDIPIMEKTVLEKPKSKPQQQEPPAYKPESELPSYKPEPEPKQEANGSASFFDNI